MKNFIAPILFLILITGFSCHSQENTKVISIGFHSDDCADCNDLKSKMKKMNRAFFTSAIVFIKYDKTNAKSQAKAENKLAKWGILEMAQKVKGLKKVILYDAKTKEMIVQLDYVDSVEELERKINRALGN